KIHSSSSYFWVLCNIAACYFAYADDPFLFAFEVVGGFFLSRCEHPGSLSSRSTNPQFLQQSG
ncbi:MAG: hypothetical protein R3301_01095, partial [Saprospiraceae bacterium]|nr:hypothetical protein [Saprospiraceae bacterium]